jgi:uncharacterized membrane protein YagU involved in acid resistance
MNHAIFAPQDSLHGATDWKAGAWAGVIAGVVFMMLEMAMVWMFLGQSPWGPPHMIAAMVLGKDVLPPPETWAPFDLTIMMVAMVVHFALSIVYGLIGAWLVHRFDAMGALMVGAAFGLAIYIVNFYLVAPVAFPWFEMARNWVSVFAHVMFGAALGLAYVRLRKARK